MLEATSLQADLRRAGIEPWAWIINNSVAAAQPVSPLLRQRAHNELREIGSVANRHARRYAVVPLLKEEPVEALFTCQSCLATLYGRLRVKSLLTIL